MSRKSKLIVRSPTFKQDFQLPGVNPKKRFMDLLTRYGIKGYKLGITLGQGLFADFYFPNLHIAIWITPKDLNIDRLNVLSNLGTEVIILESATLDAKWLEACAIIKDTDLHHLTPMRLWSSVDAKEFEKPESASKKATYHYEDGILVEGPGRTY